MAKQQKEQEETRSTQTKQRIAIGVNRWKEKSLTEKLNRYCLLVDEQVIPAIRKLIELGEKNGLKDIKTMAEGWTVDSLLHYLADYDNLKTDYISQSVNGSGVEGQSKYLLNMVKEKAEKEFEELFTKHGIFPWDNTKVDDELKKYLLIDTRTKELRFNADMLLEDVTVYLTDEEEKAHHQLQHIAEEITEMMKGKEIPYPLVSNPLRYFYWNDEAKEVRIETEKVPYKELAKETTVAPAEEAGDTTDKQ